MAEPAIRKAITVLDMLSRAPETVRLAELRMKKILDEKSMLDGAKEEGREEGRQEGLEAGKEEERVQLILKQYKKGTFGRIYLRYK
jgi:predicted transposase YdaD